MYSIYVSVCVSIYLSIYIYICNKKLYPHIVISKVNKKNTFSPFL